MFVYESQSGISTRKWYGLQLTFICLLYSPTVGVMLDIWLEESRVGKGRE